MMSYLCIYLSYMHTRVFHAVYAIVNAFQIMNAANSQTWELKDTLIICWTGTSANYSTFCNLCEILWFFQLKCVYVIIYRKSRIFFPFGDHQKSISTSACRFYGQNFPPDPKHWNMSKVNWTLSYSLINNNLRCTPLFFHFCRALKVNWFNSASLPLSYWRNLNIVFDHDYRTRFFVIKLIFLC